jgi:hypothetical protein
VTSPAGEDHGPRVALFGVDAFTDRPFGGNPAMVCLLPGPAGDGWMQRVAAELNQPATAFLHDRRLRWFTPAVELQLCGHGTLAAAHVLYEAGLVAPADPIVFQTVSGPLRAWRQDGLVWIEFAPVSVQETAVPGAVLEALNLGGVIWFGANKDEYVVVLRTPGEVEAVRPDLKRIRRLPVSRVLVTARAVTTPTLRPATSPPSSAWTRTRPPAQRTPSSARCGPGDLPAAATARSRPPSAVAAWPSPSKTTGSTSAVTPSPSPEGSGSPKPATRDGKRAARRT